MRLDLSKRFRNIQRSSKFLLKIYLFVYLFSQLVSYCLFSAIPTAYGSSWLGVESELHLLAQTTATATLHPSCILSLCCSLSQHQILNSLSEARDQTHMLMDTNWVLNPLSHDRNSFFKIFNEIQCVNFFSLTISIFCFYLGHFSQPLMAF